MPRIVFNPFTGNFDYVLRPGEGQVCNEVPAGSINGINVVFTTANNFIDGSEKLHLNGVRLKVGVGCDYLTSESGGLGTGFDTLTLSVAPITTSKTDQLLVDYTKD